MIRLARMFPGVSRKSGRRYLRGQDKRGNLFWVLEDPNGDGWILSIDPSSRGFDAATLDLTGERLFEQVGDKPILPAPEGDQ